MKKDYKKSDAGEIEYTRVVVILADNPINGYDDSYYLPEYKMYINKEITQSKAVLFFLSFFQLFAVPIICKVYDLQLG